MKGQIGYVTVVKMVIGVMLVLVAFSIGRSCAEAILPSVSEGVTSFNNFVDVIENTKNWASGTKQNAGLIMDKNTAIFGFAKGAQNTEVFGYWSPFTGRQWVPRKVYVRPQSCGDNSKACACLCSFTTTNPIVCNSEKMRCRALSDGINFVEKVSLDKMAPLAIQLPEEFPKGQSIVNGFIIERESEGPRRFTVSIEKTKDNKLAICARSPCIES